MGFRIALRCVNSERIRRLSCPVFPFDCGGEGRLKDIRSRFGEDVDQIVKHCTDSWEEPKPEWGPRKRKYVNAIASKPARSLLVSLADKTHNVGAIVSDLYVIGDDLWSRFTGRHDGTLCYYSALVDALGDKLSGTKADPLLGMFRRRVDEMKRFAAVN
jgi:hypothetical protein